MTDLIPTQPMIDIALNVYYGKPPDDIDEWFADLQADVEDVQARLWKIAHKLAWGQGEYGEGIYAYLDQLTQAPGYLANLKTIGGRFPPSRRRELADKGYPEFPMSYYQELCPFDDEQQEKIMDAIVELDLKRGDIRELKQELGIRSPATGYELALDNDALAGSNTILKRRVRELEAQVAEYEQHPADEAWSRDTCPECGGESWVCQDCGTVWGNFE